jgi:hypothetical protein
MEKEIVTEKELEKEKAIKPKEKKQKWLKILKK